MTPLINRTTGEIHLDNHWILKPGLSVETVANLIGNRLSGTDGRIRWFSHIPFSSLYGDLDMGLAFSGETLIGFKAQIKGGMRAKDAEIKAKQDALLINLLGNPSEEKYLVTSEIGRFLYRMIGKSWPTSAKELTWSFAWGRVVSAVEPRDTVAEFQVHWRPT